MAIVDADRCESFCEELWPPELPVAPGLLPPSAAAAVGMTLRLPVTGVLVSADPDAIVDSTGMKM